MLFLKLWSIKIKLLRKNFTLIILLKKQCVTITSLNYRSFKWSPIEKVSFYDINRSTTKISSNNTLLKIPKRTMINFRYLYTLNAASSTLFTSKRKLVNRKTLNKNASYEVDRQTTKNTRHSQAQENVIIQNKKGVFQYNSLVRSVCAEENCVHKLCNKPCGSVAERTDIGFATHNGKISEQHFSLSSTDLEKNSRLQVAKMHQRPIYSSDQNGFLRINYKQKNYMIIKKCNQIYI